MMVDLKTYPAMKDSGVKWLGELPAHWEVRRLGQIGSLSKGNGGNKEDEIQIGVPCVRYGDLYTTHTHFIEKSRSFVASETARNYTSISFGDVLFAASGETIEEIGKSAANLIQAPACCGGDVILFRPQRDLVARYMGYATDCRPVATHKATMGRGITVKHIYGDQLKYLAIPLPPLTEQAAIVRFLDDSDRRIQRYIRAKQKLITLLEEQQQAVVHEAVTGRVDIRTGQPYPAYKDSGVEWLGDVPEHWEMRRLKSKLRPVDRRSSSGTETLLSLRRDLGVVVYAEHFSRPPQGATLVGYKLVEAGQLVINRLQANNGLLFCSGLSGVVSPDYSVFAPRSPVDMEYLGNLLRTVTYKAHFRRESTGLGTGSAGFLRLYDDRLLATPVALPPLEEQSTLLVSLSEITASLCRAIGRQHVEIELLREYRVRLIADVVTGKLDVRGAAAGLPEVDSLADDDALTTQAAETGVMELEDATESPEEFAMENEATI